MASFFTTHAKFAMRVSGVFTANELVRKMAGTFTTYAKIAKQMSIVFTAYAEFALSLLGKQIPFLNCLDSICYEGEYINRIRNNKLIRYFHWRFYGLLQIWHEYLYTIFDCSGIRIPLYQRRFVFDHC